jgi:hypothetical protein
MPESEAASFMSAWRLESHFFQVGRGSRRLPDPAAFFRTDPVLSMMDERIGLWVLKKSVRIR